MKLRLIDLDGSVVAQPALRHRLESGSAESIDLRTESGRLRLWARHADMERFARRIDSRGSRRRGAEVTFLGSGDFHHLTAPLVARIPGPLSIIHFDNHPDWSNWPPAYHCGSWVNRVLEQSSVAKVVTIGPTAKGPTWPQFKGANLALLKSRRFELHPWCFPPSRVLGQVDPGPRHQVTGRSIHWRNLVDVNWIAFLDELIGRLPTTNIYITIDKDVLHTEDAVTNWNQGEMRLEHVIDALRTIASLRRIVGVDICGEFSPPRFRHLGKRLLAHLDQPRPPRTPQLEINAQTNARLLAALEDIGI